MHPAEPAAAGYFGNQAGRHEPGEHHRQHGGAAGGGGVRAGGGDAAADRGIGVEEDFARPGHLAGAVSCAGDAEYHRGGGEYYAGAEEWRVDGAVGGGGNWRESQVGEFSLERRTEMKRNKN